MLNMVWWVYMLLGGCFLKLFIVIIAPRYTLYLRQMLFGLNSVSLLIALKLGYFFYVTPALEVELTWDFFFFFPMVLLVDGISVSLIILTIFLFTLCVDFSFFSIWYSSKEFLSLLYIIELCLIFVFTFINLFYFYIVFETVLIPMFFIIGIWGSRQRRIHAVFQFFFYTAMGSFFMLLALLYIYSQLQSLDWSVIRLANFSATEEFYLWLAFFLAFSVKIPLFPFHIWLPEAHVEAPTIGSVILAGILLKMGTYGLYRFVILLFSTTSILYTPYVQVLCLLGIVYTSLTTIRQIDLKKMMAYSSVGHMSYVVLGLFSNNILGISGAFMLMLGHGLISAALFFLIGFVYYRFQTRLLPLVGGLKSMQFFSWFFLFFTLGNVSFPGTVNFVGEFLCITGCFLENWFVGLIAVSSIILTAAYSFWLFNRVCFGQIRWVTETSIFSRLPRFQLLVEESMILSSLMFFSLLFGICPNLILSFFNSLMTLHLWYLV